MSSFTPRLAALCLLAAALPLAAQDNSGYTSVALFKVKLESTSSFVENMTKFIKPVGDTLIKDGTLLAYGLDLDMLHQPGAANAALWMEVADFAAFGKLEEAIGAALKSSKDAAAVWAATDMAAHSDILVRHLFSNMKALPAGALPYSNFYAVKLKPGKLNEFSEFFAKHQKPLYDKMVADGVILGYSVDTEAIHTASADMVWIIALMKDLGAKDRMLAVTRARPDRRQVQVMLDALTVEGSHRDSLSQSVIYVTK